MMKSTNKNRFAGLARLALIPVLALLLASLSEKETVVIDDDLERNGKVAQAAMQPNGKEENPQDTLKSREEMLRYLSNNIKYPAEARKNGHIGTVVLFARVNQNGTIKDVLEINPEEGFVDSEDIVIVGYTKAENGTTDAKSKPSVSYNLKNLKPEGRRVIESFPVLEIPELYGQTLKFSFKFEIR